MKNITRCKDNEEIPLPVFRYVNKNEILHELMPYRVRDILLVSSLYDQFILEEDGILAERLIWEYQSLNLSFPPRVTRVSTGNEALEMLKKRHFDLVITMIRLSDIDPFGLGKAIKEKYPDLPVVLLLMSAAEMERLPPENEREGIDYIYQWTGDSSLFLAIIKVVEDMKNVEHDVGLAMVRVIILIEDTPMYYSIFLPLLYKEIVRETQRQVEEGVNQVQKLLRMRLRPKIIFVTNYEDAIKYVNKYEYYLLGVISDVGYPVGGKKDLEAGIKLVQTLKKRNPWLPILLQSSDPDNKKRAEELEVSFLYKLSSDVLSQMRKFVKENLIMGDFVFKSPDNKIIGRAKNLDELVKLISKVPIESIIYHAKQNHFSSWLFAKGEYELAYQIRPLKVSDFKNAEELRKYLIKVFTELKQKIYTRNIIAYSRHGFIEEARFTRIGRGSLGGKGRGLAFAFTILNQRMINEKYPNVDIGIPQTIAISVEYFDKFMEQNDLYEVGLNNNLSDEEIQRIFVSKPLPEELVIALRDVLSKIKKPIAVRSSSLLEDSQFQPFAGIYSTYMLPNNHPDLEVRLKHICTAIKLVYSSIFSKLAKSYIQTIGQKIEIEKMAIVIQVVVGKQHGERYYPDFSGVAQSINYYPISYMNPEDGVVTLALGLGAMIVEGGQVLTYCPKYPKIIPQMSSTKDAINNSQKEFYAVDLTVKDFDLLKGEHAFLVKLSIMDALKDGTLKWIASTYDYVNDRIIDSLVDKGVPIITFAHIIKYNRFPLNDIILDLLKMGRESFGAPVELEFAVNLDREKECDHKFYILQLRPMVDENDRLQENIDRYIDQAFIYSTNVLGNGVFENIYDIVYVDPEKFDASKTTKIKEEIHNINKELMSENREYVLIGPGRWGTSDPFLGIPVDWADINFARAIVEASLPNFMIDPSQGMHFFVNVTSTRRAYFTVSHKSKTDFIDWDWLTKQPQHCKTEHVIHVKLKDPVTIKVNGKKGKGVIIKPQKEKNDKK